MCGENLTVLRTLEFQFCRQIVQQQHSPNIMQQAFLIKVCSYRCITFHERIKTKLKQPTPLKIQMDKKKGLHSCISRATLLNDDTAKEKINDSAKTVK